MEALTAAIQNLKLWATETSTEDNKQPNAEDVLAALSQLADSLIKDGNDKKVLTETLVQSEVTEILSTFLQPESALENRPTKEKSAEIVAELAKTDIGRKHCSSARIISALLNLLTSENGETTVQACRALGNICYDNDNGRSIVYEHQGADKLLQFLQSAKAKSEGKEQLRTVATGFLLNLINTYELTQDRVLELGVLNILCEYLEKFGQEEDVCIHVLLVLNCLADNNNGRNKIIEKNICGVLVGLMEVEVSSEVVEAVLELIGNIAEDDTVKYQLATTGLCHNLIKFLKMGQVQQEGDDSLNVTKISCDLIVLLLTGDESMEYLYGGGQGIVYEETLLWLQSKDEILQTAAALAVGNFARKDEHCIQMVSKGITKQLVELLSKHSTKDGDIRLQHAILSALRNLAIPAVNKSALLNMGVIDTILPMISVDTFPVVFKLLGTLRMLVDGQEEAARHLGRNRDCISRIVEWCATEDHPGVKGEANRLQAWLIKNSKCAEVVKLVVQTGGLPFLISMTNSEHEVMQNEALIALSLTCRVALDDVEEALLATDVSSKLKRLLADDNIGSEVKCNVLTLIATITKSEKLKEELQSKGIPELVNRIAAAENAILCEAAKAVKQLFESG